MKRIIFVFLSVILLTACAPGQSASIQPTQEAFITATLPPTNTPWPALNAPAVTPTSTTDPSIFAQLFSGSNANSEFTRTDQQGMVVVEVTPLNFGMPGDTLDFDVSLNTHSVDLSMDLAKLATLITDSGIIVQASLWDAPRGGHHVSGKLVFPTIVNGVSVLDGAAKLTLQIRDLDAPMRIFEWNLQ